MKNPEILMRKRTDEEVECQCLLEDAVSMAFVKAIEDKLDVSIIKMFYEKNKSNIYFDVSSDNTNYPLMIAIVEHPETKELLTFINRECSDIVNTDINRLKETVLHYVFKGMMGNNSDSNLKKTDCLEKTKVLIANSASIKRENYDGTIPFWVLLKAYGNSKDKEILKTDILELIKLIIEQEPEIINFVNSKGNSFFDYAYNTKQRDGELLPICNTNSTRLILELGADPSIKNESGISFVDTCKQYFYHMHMEMLKPYVEQALEAKKERDFTEQINTTADITISI